MRLIVALMTYYIIYFKVRMKEFNIFFIQVNLSIFQHFAFQNVFKKNFFLYYSTIK